MVNKLEGFGEVQINDINCTQLRQAIGFTRSLAQSIFSLRRVSLALLTTDAKMVGQNKIESIAWDVFAAGGQLMGGLTIGTNYVY